MSHVDQITQLEAILRDPANPALHQDVLATANPRLLRGLCRRFGIPESGSNEQRRQRLLNASQRLDREELARSAYYGVDGYEALHAHMQAVLGGVCADGLWRPSRAHGFADAHRVVTLTSERGLRALIPGGAYSFPAASLLPLFVHGGRQYAEISGGAGYAYRTATSPFRFVCTADAWAAHEAVQAVIAHYQYEE